MTDDSTPTEDGQDGIDSVREAVGEKLMRAARAHESAPWFRRRRWLALAACVVVVAVPGGIAVAQFLPDDPEPLSQPAPPPLFSTDAFASCPESVQEQILALGSLSEYRDTPGYPVEGCPTLEDLEAANPNAREPALRSPGPASQRCEQTLEELSTQEKQSAEWCRELAPSGD